MNIEQINSVVKKVWGRSFKAQEKGNNMYELVHTIGINGATGSARGRFEVIGNDFIVRYVWASQGHAFANQVHHLGYAPKVYEEPVEGDTAWNWTVVKFAAE